MMSTAEVRQRFLDFFAQRDHQVVSSSPLVPGNDKTLLFTNAGMVQFKDVFLGDDQRSYRRATTSQRCVRAGGKHNDLENVGYTARHHTFFEMLGNFSFGDYFKRDAIQYAWDFLTKELGLPEEKLWITVYEEDDEAATIWLDELKVSSERFSRIGAKDNFWSMGDTGPCGPCSEIFYDHGADVPGGPPGTPEEDGDRYIEIWNLVFMQYNRDRSGTLTPLPKPSVDTGMGLERLVAVMQHVHNNYDIDLFQDLLKAAGQVCAVEDIAASSLRVIADHIRACSFLIVDSVLPANDGRGYVLRRIIRRAIRHAYKLGVTEPFFHKLVAPLVEVMGEAYPELVKAQAHVEKVLLREEQDFARTLDNGMKLLEQALASLVGKEIPGQTVFTLYDTYGFPVDLTNDIARERGLSLDMPGYEQAMAKQRDQSGKGDQFKADYSSVQLDARSEFCGYEQLQEAGQVVALLCGGEQVQQLNAGDDGVVVLDRTPFYAESGGQKGDAGQLLADGIAFVVTDTQKQGPAAHAHFGQLEAGTLTVGQTLQAKVDAERRQAIVCNHSATHLLHAVLREQLGEHVAQKGSLVAPERLRFDFSHYEPVTAEQLSAIERQVNEQVQANQATSANLMSYDQAIDSGAMALFGEKYGDQVRVLSIGVFSTELCGGTHVQRSGDIGGFKIISEGGVASGIRRIEAITGAAVTDWQQQTSNLLERLATQLKGDVPAVEQKLAQVLERNKQLEKQLSQLQGKLASNQGTDLVAQAVDIGGIKVLAAKLEGADGKVLRETVDQLKQKLGQAAVVLAAENDGKVSLVAGVTKAESKQVKAGALVNFVAEQVGGRGGGRPDMAQAGGNDPAALPAALAGVNDWVASQLNG